MFFVKRSPRGVIGMSAIIGPGKRHGMELFDFAAHVQLIFTKVHELADLFYLPSRCLLHRPADRAKRIYTDLYQRAGSGKEYRMHVTMFANAKSGRGGHQHFSSFLTSDVQSTWYTAASHVGHGFPNG